MHRRLAGRRSLVTGGGSGIGRASALRMAAEGAAVAVAVVDVRRGLAEAVAGEILELAVARSRWSATCRRRTP